MTCDWVRNTVSGSEYRAKEISIVFFQTTYITKCRNVIMGFQPDDIKNKLLTPALMLRSQEKEENMFTEPLSKALIPPALPVLYVWGHQCYIAARIRGKLHAESAVVSWKMHKTAVQHRFKDLPEHPQLTVSETAPGLSCCLAAEMHISINSVQLMSLLLFSIL